LNPHLGNQIASCFVDVPRSRDPGDLLLLIAAASCKGSLNRLLATFLDSDHLDSFNPLRLEGVASLKESGKRVYDLHFDDRCVWQFVLKVGILSMPECGIIDLGVKLNGIKYGKVYGFRYCLWGELWVSQVRQKSEFTLLICYKASRVTPGRT